MTWSPCKSPRQPERGWLEPLDSTEKLRVGLGLEEGIGIRTEVCQGHGECWTIQLKLMVSVVDQLRKARTFPDYEGS